MVADCSTYRFMTAISKAHYADGPVPNQWRNNRPCRPRNQGGGVARGSGAIVPTSQIFTT